MLRRGDRVAVGVSGGKDSAALLYALDKLAKRIGQVTLLPVLIDEGIAGYRDVAAVNAVQLCKRLGLNLTVFSYSQLFGASMDQVMVARSQLELQQGGRQGLLHSCGYCGVFRKQSLNIAATKLGANKLATGHNADDAAQTFLMNLMNNQLDKAAVGSAVHATRVEDGGLVPRIKPLILNPEIECALYARFNQIPFHQGGCPYANESLRGSVKDFLNATEEGHPGVKLNLLKASQEIEGSLASSKKLAAKTLKQCPNCQQPFSDEESNTCRSCQLTAQLGF
jgi:uncharacterized protein (TIGR00269 family)